MRLRNARRARAPHRFSAHLRRETSLGRVFPLCSDGLIKQAGRRLRTFIVASMVMTVFLTDCDPVGLRRICVPLTQRPNDSATIEIDRPDVQEVLRVLDAVVEPLGFKASPEPTTNDSIRVYWLNRQPATVEGRSYSRNVPIRVIHTPKGIEVAFGHFGFLGGTPEPAVRAFKDARAALVSRYGSKNVKTKTFGGVSQTGADHSR